MLGVGVEVGSAPGAPSWAVAAGTSGSRGGTCTVFDSDSATSMVVFQDRYPGALAVTT